MAGKSLRERNQAIIGLIGIVIAVAIVAASLNINRIRSVLGETTYSADFSDAGGARSGDDVRIDGVTVGSVKGVELEGKHVEITFRVGGVKLGNKTKVAVRSENALGSKYLAVEPGGEGDESTIPVQRTSPGYAVSEVLGRLTANNSEIDVDQVTTSFTSLTKVLEATPEEFGDALDGVSRLSRTISKRDAELDALLKQASVVSSVLADRSKQVTDLFAAGSRVFAEISSQRERLEVLFDQVGKAADQITLLVAENRKTIGADLTEIKHISKVLNDYRDDLGFVLQTLPKYARSLGEAVGSGPFFQAYIPNLIAPESLANVDSILKSLINSDTTGYIKKGDQ
ncbi:hypothetical protein ASD11_00810 [Aeromicrobium sp. Root495]|uniref:MCE family protein n=1 Tax=Aeromicrobium sp. Root495 TaxID=1736550 RepID=UPI0006F2F79D|nr:MCE family protein [Aeromicrobium sp. Root495]KQY58244.1 hypothetical protein ASD11_00810 [Aeromicrobium sp. Root495]